MNSEKLVSLASAHGVDLVAAARVGAKPAPRDTVTQTKRGIRSTTLRLPPKNRAKGTPDRSVLRPTWTIAEIGQAAQGVPEIPFQAALYAWAGDRSHYWRLHQALYRCALSMAKQKGWPAVLRDLHGIESPYLGHLAALVLDWEANRHVFALAPQMYGVFMRVTQRTWEKHIQGAFEELSLTWLKWLGTAAKIMQPHLADVDDYAEVRSQESRA